MSAAAASQPSSIAVLLRICGRLSLRVGAVMLLTVSAMVLARVGYPYGSVGGNPLTKIHPATLFIVAGSLLFLASAGFSRALAATVRDYPGLVPFGAAFVLLACQAAVIGKPLSILIDTFVSGLFLLIALIHLPRVDLSWLSRFIHVFFVVNALVALAEITTGFRLTPVVFDGQPAPYEWRATALLGHPLSNAALTGVYILVISGRAGRAFPHPARLFLIGLQIAAMAAFSGRFASVILLAFLLLRLFPVMASVLAGSRFTFSRAATTVAFAGGFVVVSVAAFTAGLFDRFISRFIDDQGSAATRSAMLDVFDRIDTASMIFGPYPSAIARAQIRLDITTAIESFVVAFPAYYGLLVAAIFFVGLAFFIREVIRAGGPGTAIPILFYILVASGSNGISSKTTDLTLSILIAVVLARASASRTGYEPTTRPLPPPQDWPRLRPSRY